MSKKILVLDTETTGLSAENDDILQISMIDNKYGTVLNTYCKNVKKSEWPEAMKVNGITPEMVAEEKPASSYKDLVQKAIDDADLIVHYNGQFDLRFLSTIGVTVPEDKKQFDVMTAFMPIYGERYQNGNFKRKKLVDAAEYFKYKFDAHDSLEDCKATLYCYYKIVNPVRKVLRKPLRKLGIKI